MIPYVNRNAPFVWNPLDGVFGTTGLDGNAYDPTDSTRTFQDSDRQVVAEAGAPVGLILSGVTPPTPMLLDPPVNGTLQVFDNFTADGYDVVASGPTGGAVVYEFTLAALPNRGMVKVTFDAPVAVGDISITLTNSAIGGGTWGSNRGFVEPGYNEFYLVANNINRLYIQIFTTSSTQTELTINNIEVTEYHGAHAYQTVAAARPMLIQSGQNRVLRFDGADDALLAIIDSDITGDIVIAGTNRTIIEPISYTDGQQISFGPTTYTGGAAGVWSTLGDIVGIMMIDKTLTSTERAQILKAYRDKGAGDLA